MTSMFLPRRFVLPKGVIVFGEKCSSDQSRHGEMSLRDSDSPFVIPVLTSGSLRSWESRS